MDSELLLSLKQGVVNNQDIFKFLLQTIDPLEKTLFLDLISSDRLHCELVDVCEDIIEVIFTFLFLASKLLKDLKYILKLVQLDRVS